MTFIQEINNLTFRLNTDAPDVIFSDLKITDIVSSKNMLFISNYQKGIFATQINCFVG